MPEYAMHSLADSLRRWTRRHGIWITLLAAMGLFAKALPVMAVAPSGHGPAIGGAEAHACAPAATQDERPVASVGSPANGCCADTGQLCAQHCEPLMLTALNLPMAEPEPAMPVPGRLAEPFHFVHPPLLRPPRG